MRLAAGALVVTSLLALSGCATLSEDAGIGDVQARIDTRLEAGEKQPLQWLQTAEARQQAAAEVDRLLASGPLSADAAVRIALLNNPELQMRLAELGIADSDRVQAGRLRNPGFSYGRLKRGDEIEIERTFLFDIFGLLTIPARTAIEERRVEETQLRVAGEVMRIAHDTRKAWIDAVAARQAETYWLQVREAAEASATLGRRMAEVGHWGVREQAREQGFYADATARLAMARQQSVETREALIRQLGLWGGQTSVALPERLPDLPGAPRTDANVEQAAIRDRLDVRLARRQAEGLAKSAGLTQATRFVNVLEGRIMNNSSNEMPTQRGYEIELSLPIFDWGDAKLARAEAVYMQAVENVRATALRARSEARESWLRYRTAFDLARHYRDEIVPLRKRIAEENVLRYNGMLISVFELLMDAREQIQSVIGAIEAQRDFWRAEADLRTALTVGSPAASSLSNPQPAARAAAAGGH
ncbi:MAG: TolC family protein [Halothiobacillaceae bacterium]|nr:MAG: TolC family protein [Halothiobacillaceae bacterium]